MIKMLMKFGYVIFSVLCFIACKTHSQDASVRNSDALNKYVNVNFFGIVDSTAKIKYPFIHFERNHYQFYTYNSPNFEKLFYDIQQMVRYKDRKLNFYHIGGSHIQADIYSNYMREQLQSYWKGLPGERGLVFPFDLAGTNNPWNYAFHSSNRWKGYRSVVTRPDSVSYGIMGMAISCTDSLIDIGFSYKKTTSTPPIDHVRIYHNKGEMPYTIQFDTIKTPVLRQTTNTDLGYTDTYFTKEAVQFDVKFTRLPDSLFIDTARSKTLFIYGFHLMNKRPGISYTSIGVNGAGLYTYIDNVNFEEQLMESPPDFVAFSVGTNDGNTTYAKFRPEIYKKNLETMMQKVFAANPNCAILLTVPNDAYYMKKSLNRNIAREREMIIELAKEYQLPVWDFYGIMGELGSSKTWQRSGLMRTDLVHFTSEGYKLKGEMFFESFLKWLEQMELRQQISLIKRNN